jgi:hypothetical protein
MRVLFAGATGAARPDRPSAYAPFAGAEAFGKAPPHVGIGQSHRPPPRELNEARLAEACAARVPLSQKRDPRVSKV